MAGWSGHVPELKLGTPSPPGTHADIPELARGLAQPIRPVPPRVLGQHFVDRLFRTTVELDPSQRDRAFGLSQYMRTSSMPKLILAWDTSIYPPANE